MPYIVRRGKVDTGDRVFGTGKIVAGAKKGDLDDLDEGTVEWVGKAPDDSKPSRASKAAKDPEPEAKVEDKPAVDFDQKAEDRAITQSEAKPAKTTED
jgi:hypothetical protein